MLPASKCFLRPGVIGGKQMQHAAAHKVGPAVTQMHDVELFARQGCKHDRGAHPLPLRVALCLEQDLVVGTQHGEFQPLGQRLLAAGRFTQRSLDGLHCNPAGLGAPGCAGNTVGHHGNINTCVLARSRAIG